MERGWWKIEYGAVSDNFIEPNETDLAHIGEMIRQGYLEGEIVQDSQEEE